jgi:hypothetical protein
MCRRILLTLALLCVIAGNAGAAVGTVSQTESRLSQLTGVPVTCSEVAAWQTTTVDAGHAGAKGLYDVGGGRILLSPPVCDLIARFQDGYRPRKQLDAYGLAEAIFVLGHEAAHAAGLVDETQADCRSAATMRTTVATLGGSRAYAAALWSYAAPYVAGRC